MATLGKIQEGEEEDLTVPRALVKNRGRDKI